MESPRSVGSASLSSSAGHSDVWPIAPLWTVEDVAAYLQVPVQTLYFWRQRGTGPQARKMGKYLRYRPADVVAWFDSLGDPAA